MAQFFCSADRYVCPSKPIKRSLYMASGIIYTLSPVDPDPREWPFRCPKRLVLVQELPVEVLLAWWKKVCS